MNLWQCTLPLGFGLYIWTRRIKLFDKMFFLDNANSIKVIPEGWESNQFNLVLEKLNWEDWSIFFKKAFCSAIMFTGWNERDFYLTWHNHRLNKIWLLHLKYGSLVQPKPCSVSILCLKYEIKFLSSKSDWSISSRKRSSIVFFADAFSARQSWKQKLLLHSFSNNCLPNSMENHNLILMSSLMRFYTCITTS